MSSAPVTSRSVARSGAFSFVGAVTSAVMGLLFTVVIGRVLGPSGAGVVLQAIAAFTIALSVARAGLDTTAVWLLPRVTHEDPRRLRSALASLLVPAVVFGSVAGFGLYAVGTALQARQQPLSEALHSMAWFLPFATVMTVALSATRGLGGVRPYVLVNSIGIPTARPVLVLATAWLASGSLAAALAWSAPLPVGALVSVLLVIRIGRRFERANGGGGEWIPTRPLVRRVCKFAAPRSISGVLEQAMTWLDVLIVGLLLTPAAAGIYGAATRFVGAGMILNTTLRVVVAPIYSRSLGLGQVEQAQQVYSTTTKWIVLCSTPICLAFAFFGGTTLGLLGPGFRSGATALLILACGLAVVLLTGNIHSLLLMSGHSGLAALNKLAALTANVLGLLLLVPHLGIEGAALAWSVSMVLDAGLAAAQVHRLVGVAVGGSGVAIALAVPLVAFGAPALVLRIVLGDTLSGLSVALVVGGVLCAISVFRLRGRLALADLMSISRQRNSPG